MGVTGEVIKVGAGLTGVSAAAALARHAYLEIPQGHAGLRTHSDRAIRRRNTLLTRKKAGTTYGKRGPGYHATIGLRNYEVISTQDNRDPLDDFNIDKGPKQYRVRSEINWGVIDRPDDVAGEFIYRALFNANGIDALRSSVVNICGSGLRKVMLDHETLETATSDEVQPILQQECGEELEERFGVELRRFYLLEAAQTLISAVANRGQPLDAVDLAIVSENGNGHVLGHPAIQ